MTKSEKTSGKAERLRAALRENLKRRKVQAKGRSAVQVAPDTGPESSTPPHDSAGFGADKQNHK
jgi:hypothetical protein